MAAFRLQLSRGWAALIAGLASALVVGAIAAGMAGARPSTPLDDSAEAGFARDMATHHAQAVDMAFMVRDATTDPQLRALAYDIIATQSTQRGIFMGWLQAWHLSQSSTRPRMAWMGHAQAPPSTDGAVLMHGMASRAELRRLQEATGKDSEILFLQLMIRHHEGGVIMARALLQRSQLPEVAQMATAIDSSQRVEITQMTEMLASLGARPLPSLIE